MQYLHWLGGAVHGDFGLSFTSRTPVDAMLGGTLGVSFTLAITALGLAFLVALPLGTLAALRPGGRADTSVTFMTQSFVAVPEYWLAPILEFWNWPEFDPEFLTDFARVLDGHHVVRVWGKL